MALSNLGPLLLARSYLCCLCGTPVRTSVREDLDLRVYRVRFECHGRIETRAVAWEDLRTVSDAERFIALVLSNPFAADAQAIRDREAEIARQSGWAEEGSTFAPNGDVRRGAARCAWCGCDLSAYVAGVPLARRPATWTCGVFGLWHKTGEEQAPPARASVRVPAGFVLTGETRLPRIGEWYLGKDGKPNAAAIDFQVTPQPILRPQRDGVKAGSLADPLRPTERRILLED